MSKGTWQQLSTIIISYSYQSCPAEFCLMLARVTWLGILCNVKIVLCTQLLQSILVLQYLKSHSTGSCHFREVSIWIHSTIILPLTQRNIQESVNNFLCSKSWASIPPAPKKICKQNRSMLSALGICLSAVEISGCFQQLQAAAVLKLTIIRSCLKVMV